MQNTLITIALRGITVLPRMRIYLDMNRPMSIAAATNAQKTNQNVFLVAQKDPSVENPGQEQLEQFGVIAQVKQIIKGPEDSFRVLVTGLQSAKLESIEEYVPNLIARVTVFESEKSDEHKSLPGRIQCGVFRWLDNADPEFLLPGIRWVRCTGSH